MAYVGYPAGSPQAPQSGMPGGALVATGPLTSGLGAPGTMPSAGSAGPGYFEELLNKLKGAGAKVTEAGRRAADAIGTPKGQMIAGVAAPAAYGVGSLMKGDIARGVGEIGGGVAGAGLAGGLASAAQAALPGAKGKLAAGAIRAAGGLIGGGIGGGVAGSAAQAAGNVVSAVTGQQREEGKTPGITGGTGVGLDAASQAELAKIRELMNYGVQSNVAGAQAMLPIANQYLDRQMQRQMQLNQQLGQLTGALNRQQYAFQLAGGAQSEAGANLRTMMTSNPYAASTFRA